MTPKHFAPPESSNIFDQATSSAIKDTSVSACSPPTKKPAHRDLLDWEKEFNEQINHIRSVVERAIANFKTWRILFTDYRRPKETFPRTINVVIALDRFRNSE